MKEQVLETLKKLGFVTIEVDSYHLFEYEGKGYLYSVDDNDDSFLSFAIPNIMNAESDDEEEHDDKFADMLKIESEVNAKVKYVKAVIVKESLWLACEREVYGEEDYERLLPMMIMRLFKATEFVRQELDKLQCEVEFETVENDANDENTSSQMVDVIDKWFDQFEQDSDGEDYDEIAPDDEGCICAHTIENDNNK